MERRHWAWWLLYGFGGLVAFYLVLPSLIIIPMSFSDSLLLKFPPGRFSLRWYHSFFTTPAWTGSLWLSLKVGLGTMSVATLLGVTASVGLVRGRFPGKGALHAFLLSPMIVPFVVTALAVYYFYSSLRFVGNPWALLLSHICLAIPIVVVIVSATLQDFDRSLEQAAQILGATPLKSFLKITLPIIRPGVITGALFAFIISFDEVVIAAFIGGYRAATLPKRMFENVRDEMDPTIAAISTVLVLISVALLLALSYVGKRKTGSVRET
ncbi:MAG: ABC transporter permease [Deltaproteobacteria bacterium]|nr:ABC transporter permease [Deltaproteobacteria bacterium]MBW2122150.1 ABC transporter permease [Deltaproteobacteria bacterium]